MKKVSLIVREILEKLAQITVVRFLMLIWLISPSMVFAQEAVVLGIHPYLSATELLSRFTPLTVYLADAVKKPVIIKIARDYENHIDLIGKNEVDIAFMGPASYVQMVESYGLKPLLARLEIDGKPFFQGVIIASKSSSIKSLSDLIGKRFAFGDPASTMSHLVPRFMMVKAGISMDKLATFSFLANHNNVALGVLMGEFDAGAVKEEVFVHYRERGLKIIEKTPQISEHIFVSRNNLPQEILSGLREALYDLKKHKNGPAVMSAIKSNLTGMTPVRDEQYDNLREILQTLKKTGAWRE